MLPLLSSGVKIISHSPPASPNASQLLADSEARAVTPAHPGLEERSDNGSQTVQTVTEQKAPVTEPMPKDDSAMETPVTVPEAEVSVTDTPVTVPEAEASVMETPVTLPEAEASVTETPVTVPEAEASVTETPVTVPEAEGKSEHQELLQTDDPSNGIDLSQPLFSQPEPEPIMERIMMEEMHL